MNCIIIHGCPSDADKARDPATRTYDKHWIPWVREQLTARGISTEAPLMPEPWQPDYEKFKERISKLHIDEHTILIGHSCGCAFLVRWLGETKQKIANLILVAPWKIAPPGDAARRLFYEFPIDASIRTRVSSIIMFTADNEEEEGKQSLALFHHALGGSIISLPGRGHYTIDDMGTDEFPELLAMVGA